MRTAPCSRTTLRTQRVTRGQGLLLATAMLALCFTVAEGAGWAQPGALSPRDEELFQRAVQALTQEAPERAIDALELLADRGLQHPDASYNRAVAYARRASSARRQPGDLGRAAAALEETLVLRPKDAAAAAALAQVRSEISRRSIREGQHAVAASPSPGRALTGLLAENTWAIIAAAGSATLAIGLAIGWWVTRRAARLTGAAMAATGALILVLAGAATAASRHYRLTTSKAVVVAPSARLLDGQGAPLPSRGKEGVERIPEGALVFVGEQRGNLLEVEWGAGRGWLIATQLKLLPTRPAR